MTVPYTSRRLVPPSPLPTQSARPVLGQTLAALADGVNTVAGVYARSWQTVHVSQVVETAAANLNGYVHSANGINQTVRAAYLVGPLDEALQVAVLVSSEAAGGTSTPSVTVQLEDVGGSVVDIGIKWQRSDGSLRGNEEERPNGSRRLVPTWYYSGDLRRPGLAVAALPSLPRALETVASTYDLREAVAVVRASTVSARLHAVAILPVWGQTL